MWKLFRVIDNKYKTFAIISALFTFFQVLTDLIVPSMLMTLVMIIATPNQSEIKHISIIYKDWKIFVSSSQEALTLCASLMVAFSVLGIIFGALSSFLASKVAVEIARVTRNNLFQKIQTLSASNISKFGPSSLITRLTNDVTQVQTLAILMLRLMIRAPFLFIGGLVFSLMTDLNLSITLGVMIPLMLIIIGYFAIKVMPLFSTNQKIVDTINKTSRENILGVRVIKSFNLESIQEEKFNKVNQNWLNVSTKAFSIMNIMIPIVMLVTNLSMVILAIIGRTMFESTDYIYLSANITVFMQYLGYVTGGLLLTVMVLVILLRSRVSAIRINQVMDEKPDILENVSQNIIDKANINFKNVSFKFNKDSENVLSNITFSLNEGQTLGIIGPTGSGKTTIVNLLSRVYEPNDGIIEIDNKNINDINTINLNNTIGQVFQESVLFSGTIKSNLLFGKIDATTNDIERATRIACASDFINNFEDKLDHVVEQRGKNLSGGQKQRLQIARAIIRNPKILVLDDSTSALDAVTDKKLRHNIKKEMSKTTTIIIAQKINSIKDADKIIVLDKGKMIGYGKHKDLIQDCALYKDIARSQLSKEELENV